MKQSHKHSHKREKSHITTNNKKLCPADSKSGAHCQKGHKKG